MYERERVASRLQTERTDAERQLEWCLRPPDPKQRRREIRETPALGPSLFVIPHDRADRCRLRLRRRILSPVGGVASPSFAWEGSISRRREGGRGGHHISTPPISPPIPSRWRGGGIGGGEVPIQGVPGQGVPIPFSPSFFIIPHNPHTPLPHPSHSLSLEPRVRPGFFFEVCRGGRGGWVGFPRSLRGGGLRGGGGGCNPPDPFVCLFKTAITVISLFRPLF